jgi:cytochrome c-type biogenesis protein CcmH/NrfF
MDYDKFVLTINIGNDAMQSNLDIALALREVADRVEEGQNTGKIQDYNGNKVGRYDLE